MTNMTVSQSLLLMCLTMTSFVITASSSMNKLVQIQDCICPEQDSQVVYECTVCGQGATVWNGSLFNCTRGGILLRHNEFEPGPAIGECNQGAVTAHSISVENMKNSSIRCFSSQLIVPVNQSVNNKTVTCVHVDDTTIKVVNTTTFHFTTEPFPPPDGLRLSGIDPTHIKLDWDPLMVSCPSLNYYIMSTCGSCPRITSNTSITCTDMTINGQTCNLSVQTKVCTDILGEMKTSLAVKLQVPNAPNVTTSATVNLQCNVSLVFIVNINTSFSDNQTFNISDWTSGSATHYIIEYSDHLSNEKCYSEIIPTTSCGLQSGACSHSIRLGLSSPCYYSIPGGLTVRVIAVNILGESPKSDPVSVIIPYINGSVCNSESHDQDKDSAFLILLATNILTTLSLMALITALIVLLKKLSMVKKELLQAKTPTESQYYEEIIHYTPSLPSIDTSENAAYSNRSVHGVD